MSLHQELLWEHSARQTQRLADYACDHPKALAKLLQLFWYGAERERQWAADVLGWVGQCRPRWLVPHIPGLLAAAQPAPTQHPAVRRAVARVLQFVPVPKEWQALAFDTCLAMLRAPREAVATCAYSLTAAGRLAGSFPELAAEVIGAIENVLITTDSTALRSRAARESPKLRDLVREVLPD